MPSMPTPSTPIPSVPGSSVPRSSVRRCALLLAPLALLAGAGLGARTSLAQQPPFRPSPGRYSACALAGDERVLVLDTWTGRLHAAPPGAALGEGVKAWVVDLPEALAWERPLARDVSGGHTLQHGLPLAGTGAGAPVFEWHPVGGRPGALDTRAGVHYAVEGALGPGGSVVRTDLRLLSRSVRPLRTATGQ